MCRQNHWFVWIGLLSALGLVLALGLSLDATPALAHGGAELTVAPTVVAPGGVISVTGEGVEAGEEFTLTLEGMTFQITLGTVVVSNEDFHQTFSVPADTPPDTYQVKATSAEGEVLTAELTVQAGAATAEPTTPAKPSAAPMQLDRSKSTGQLAVIIAGLLLSAGLGLALVRMQA